jgi:peptidylprolyl isomerase
VIAGKIFVVKGWIVPVLAMSAALAIGCGGDQRLEASGAEVATDASKPAKAVEQLPRATAAQAGKRPKPEVPQGSTSGSLAVRDLIIGTGELAETGKILVVSYVAGIYETGEELEWTGNRPVGFLFGGGDWSYGFEEGLAGMRVGGRRELVFPTTPATLPPGSKLGDTLVYVVDLLEITEPRG